MLYSKNQGFQQGKANSGYIHTVHTIVKVLIFTRGT